MVRKQWSWVIVAVMIIGYLAPVMAYDTPGGLSILFIDAGGDPTAYIINTDGTVNQSGIADTAVVTTEAGVDNQNYQGEGDFNNDGRTDIVFVEENGGARFIALINNQDGTFTRVTTPGVTAAPNYVFGVGSNEKNHIGDVDGDEYDDIVFMYRENGSNNGIYTHLGNGDGTFSTTPVTSQVGNIIDAGGEYTDGAEVQLGGDFNGDGTMDLLHSLQSNNSFEVYLSNGDGTFGSRIDTTGMTSLNIGQDLLENTVAGDFDNDGCDDVVFHAFLSLHTRLSNCDGTFATTRVNGGVSPADGGIGSTEYSFAGDFNQDGNMDLMWMIENEGGTAQTRFLAGDGDGTFQAEVLDVRSSTADFGISSTQNTHLGYFVRVDDTTPDALDFGTGLTEVDTGTRYESDAIVIDSINTGTTITVSGGEYSINSGSYTSGAGIVGADDTVQLRVQSASTVNTTSTVTVTIGGVEETFSVTTVVPTVSIGTGSMVEGGLAPLLITLNMPSHELITVNFVATGGTATPFSDYRPHESGVSFAPGETTQVITGASVEDADEESAEYFRYVLTGPMNATIAQFTGVVTIIDNDTDTDGDGVPDRTEVQAGNDPNDADDYPDTDGDDVPDFVEIFAGSDPDNPLSYADNDADGVPTYVEEKNGSNAHNPGDYPDEDEDGVPTYFETRNGTDPNDEDDYLDTDGDMVPDFIETRDGSDPENYDSFADNDGDGVPSYVELRDGLDIHNPADFVDSDGDQVPDYTEGIDGTDPNDETDFEDVDGDGVPGFIERRYSTDDTDDEDFYDPDADGVPHYVEVVEGTNPDDAGSFADPDGDGVPSYIEMKTDTDPHNARDFLDADNDGVPNYVEIANESDPNDYTDFPDTDNDGVPNYVEAVEGTDPNDENDFVDADGDGRSDYFEAQFDTRTRGKTSVLSSSSTTRSGSSGNSGGDTDDNDEDEEENNEDENAEKESDDRTVNKEHATNSVSEDDTDESGKNDQSDTRDAGLCEDEEFNDAYAFAAQHQITTMNSCTEAAMDGLLIRIHAAKMISNYAVYVLGKTPDASKPCMFSDIGDESVELQYYAKTACQLGLMGLQGDGVTPNETFNPQAPVEKVQFITILSRLLYGNTYDGNADCRYCDHVEAMKKVDIITVTSDLFEPLKRGYAVVMLKRSGGE